MELGLSPGIPLADYTTMSGKPIFHYKLANRIHNSGQLCRFLGELPPEDGPRCKYVHKIPKNIERKNNITLSQTQGRFPRK